MLAVLPAPETSGPAFHAALTPRLPLPQQLYILPPLRLLQLSGVPGLPDPGLTATVTDERRASQPSSAPSDSVQIHGWHQQLSALAQGPSCLIEPRTLVLASAS